MKIIIPGRSAVSMAKIPALIDTSAKLPLMVRFYEIVGAELR